MFRDVTGERGAGLPDPVVVPLAEVLVGLCAEANPLSVHHPAVKGVFEGAREAALAAVDPGNAVKNHVRLEDEVLHVGGREYDLSRYEHVYVGGIGKASVQMAKALEDILGDGITEGVVNTSYGSTRGIELSRIKINEVAHQAPDQAGVDGSKEILDLAKKAGEGDLFLFVVSGGGSDTFLSPVEPDVNVYAKFIKDLKGIIGDIKKVNCVRKHVDVVKGGQLAREISPADSATLILSDVKDDPLSIIASGPTVPDESSFTEAKAIIDEMEAKGGFVPASIREHIEKGARAEIPDTPKEGDPIFGRNQNVLVGNNRMALDAAKQNLEGNGFGVELIPEPVSGDVNEFANTLTQKADALSQTITKPTVILAGGEVTVAVNKDSTGAGGRGSTLALCMAQRMEGRSDRAFMTFGTDGVDFYAGHGGAMVDGNTILEIQDLGMPLDDRVVYGDSYPPLDRLGVSILCEPTGTNVMDVYMMVVMPKRPAQLQPSSI
ncbi:Glycerate 2-kinase [uncultured archaeon]|nr:Glycerate 2-kinase [uncultured archaeon]